MLQRHFCKLKFSNLPNFLTEHLQALTQYRSSDIKDIYADMAGLAAGSIIVLTNIIFKSGRSRKQTDNE